MSFPHIRELRFLYHPMQWERFRTGTLASDWVARHLGLFDIEDQRLKGSQPTRHFFEWLASVVFRESLGFDSLVEKYESSSHAEKRSKFERIAGPEVYAEVMRDRSGVPDLFVFAPDESSWFFCEVKGGADVLRPHQDQRFQQLYELTKKPVYVAQFDKAEF